MARKYSSTSIDTTIVSTALSTSATTVTVASAADLTNGMGYATNDTFMIALSPDTAGEEICIVTGVSSNTLTITRAQAGTSATTHGIGSVVRHVLTSVELSDFETVKTNYITASSTSTVTNKTINLTSNTLTGTTAQFNTALSDGNFATIAGTETLTNKTLTSPTITTPTISSIVNTGTLTLPTSTDTLVGRATTDTLTNKTLTSPFLTTPSISNIDAAGDLLYGTADNTLGKLSIGTAGQVLTVNSGATAPEWTTPTLNSETEIATTSMSGNSFSFSSIPGTYKHLRLVLRDYNATAAGTAPLLFFTVNGGVANNSAVIGFNQTQIANYSDSTRARVVNSGAGGNGADQAANFFIPDYANTSAHKISQFYLAADDSGTTKAGGGYAIFRTTSAINSITVSLAGTETFSAGTAILYGVN